ncbi:AzlD domain-containing protein [Haloparvum sedimenti]|uniref:AzlD domain-containing protein n=1 Tax=Haloparvum sedimenti TaxID=1678448 RepID=UPI00071E7FB9|nr:AzlD domain-containing protein [Haloparvum sedimenti]
MTDYGPVAVWGVIAVIGLATYGLRLSVIHLFGRIDEVPPRAEQVLRFVPPAVLAALVAPSLVTVAPTLPETVLDEQLLAGLAAGVVAWRTENVFATIGVGMGALWLLRFVVFA